ncbi:phage tail terminator-like protein [Paracoccus liaowanqingii]|uniref:phage tail terminator-like protein n=1 Tax=Paracoccus liaowanqingii TaxID=2560053 RepID=UPI00159BBE7F|nr:phage tail terminator-like protein [Paracoccus liaowanqingii]
MTPNEIQNLIGARLASMPDALRIVVPNETQTAPAKPYLILQTRSRGDQDPALAGGAEYSEGSFVIMVVTDLNARTARADDLAYAVKAQFPKALRLAPGLAIRLSSVLGGYPDDVSWRVPVQVDWGP